MTAKRPDDYAATLSEKVARRNPCGTLAVTLLAALLLMLA